MSWLAPDMASAGFGVTSSAMVEAVVHRVLRQLYFGQRFSVQPITDLIPTEESRNFEIYKRYAAGERAVDLAEDYGVSLQRIYVLIRRYQIEK